MLKKTKLRLSVETVRILATGTCSQTVTVCICTSQFLTSCPCIATVNFCH